MRSITSWTLLLGIAAATASCGGGGGSAGADPATPAIADTSIPIVAAGPDASVAPSQMAAARIFRAAAPPDTSQLFDWAEVHFPTLFPGHQANQTFATYVYRFYPETGNYVGVDGGVFARVLGPSFGPDIVTVGVVSDFTCDVTPQACAPAGPAPIASAPATVAVDVGTVAALDGSTSYDPSGTALTYAWTMVAKPAGSAAVLAGATTAQPTFMPDMAGTYQVQLVVSNGTTASAPATEVVTALATAPPPGYILY
jgi:hypothetical protein